MARKKYMEDPDEQQENVDIKGFQNKKNHLASSPPRQGNVLGLGLLHHRARSNHKLNNANSHNPQALTPEDSLYSVIKQLSSDGLTVREMPGDGNCLFRALSDQLEGNTRNHIHHRRAVVQFMRENRSDFEPFVEDDQPFDKYVQSLSQPGTFAGNDAIVAFARLHNVTVVIHQLNSPAWLIHPTNDGRTVSSGREVHIAYHNGDHYNSVRKIGDDSDTPAEIRFIAKESLHNTKHVKGKSKNGTTNPKHHSPSPKSSTVTSGQQSKPSDTSAVSDLLFNENGYNDFWVNDMGDIDHLVDQIVRETGYPDPIVVRQALIECNFDMVITMNFILSLVMSQTDTTAEIPPTLSQPTPVNDSPLVNQQAETVTNEKDKVVHDLDTGIGVQAEPESKIDVYKEPADVSDKDIEKPPSRNSTGSISPPLRRTSASRENSTTEDEDVEVAGAVRPSPKAKLSSRQKQENKKRERKRNGNERRKLLPASPTTTTPCSDTSSQYSSMGLRSLNI